MLVGKVESVIRRSKLSRACLSWVNVCIVSTAPQQVYVTLGMHLQTSQPTACVSAFTTRAVAVGKSCLAQALPKATVHRLARPHENPHMVSCNSTCLMTMLCSPLSSSQTPLIFGGHHALPRAVAHGCAENGAAVGAACYGCCVDGEQAGPVGACQQRLLV